MIDLIVKILNEMEHLSAWTVKEVQKESTELFFVENRLDMNRSANIHEFEARVFVDFQEADKKFKGDSTVLIGICDSPDEIKQKLTMASFRAQFVRNAWYDLPENSPAESALPLTEIATLTELDENFAALHRALFNDYGFKARVNSCEVFAEQGLCRILTSKGTDVSYPLQSFVFEIVTDSNEGEEPVEIFNGYDLPHLNLIKIESIVRQQLLETEGRSQAVRNPKLENQRVILSGDAVEEFFTFYLEQATDSMVFQKMSRAQKGHLFLSETAAEDLTIEMNPVLPTSVYSKPVDDEGKILQKYSLFKKGVVENLRTSARFSHYMNIPHIGMVGTFEVAGGKESLDKYKEGDYIEILAFSSFIMDSVTGDFGGEFRLAKQVKDGQVRYLTGGAISADIFAEQNKMHFSKEVAARKYSIAPQAIIFDGMTVSGD